ncbi:hypothetical protein EDD18DRAFT_1113509 [Armillaria luteobubalina]|uniref:Uncharacterized protein n=1 Tax=Armillaria luteobubalina TaxID=153913 RepID=A0AA39PA22_9AGAR|nr:hypothetical protein EDD18DRAFT_1113509 [Armillaria luteobubalina]
MTTLVVLSPTGSVIIYICTHYSYKYKMYHNTFNDVFLPIGLSARCSKGPNEDDTIENEGEREGGYFVTDGCGGLKRQAMQAACPRVHQLLAQILRAGIMYDIVEVYAGGKKGETGAEGKNVFAGDQGYNVARKRGSKEGQPCRKNQG